MNFMPGVMISSDLAVAIVARKLIEQYNQVSFIVFEWHDG